MVTPSYNLITPGYGGQYVLVTYSDSSYGVCDIQFTQPTGNTNPANPFTSVQPFIQGSPQQEGAVLAWASKSNNLLGPTYPTQAQALQRLSEVLGDDTRGGAVGGVYWTGADVWTDPLHNPNNPFHGQLRPDDFDDNKIDPT
jgi:hypothetical protein